MGLLYGKYDLLDELKAYKVRPAENVPPHKFETGTGNFEGIAGVLGALEHFAWLGQTYGSGGGTRQELLRAGMRAVNTHEYELSRALLERLHAVPDLHIYGQDDPQDISRRVPTVSVNLAGKHPQFVAEESVQASNSLCMRSATGPGSLVDNRAQTCPMTQAVWYLLASSGS